MKLKSALKVLAGLLVAGLLLAWVLRDTDWSAFWGAIGQASAAGLALAVILNLLHCVPRVWRWGTILRPVRRSIPFRPMFSAVIIGYMTTWIVPGRVGELVRPALLSARENVPLGPSMGSIVADRLLDGVTIVALFAAAALIDPSQAAVSQSAAAIRAAAVGMLGAIAIGLAVLLVLSAFQQPVQGWLAGRSRPVAWLGRSVLSLARGVEALRDLRLLPLLLLQSLATWMVIASSTWIGLRACGVPLGFSSVLLLLPLLALGVAVPTPGNAYHAAMEFGLGWFGIEPPLATSAAILCWLVVTLPPIVLGLILLRLEGISWRHLLAIGRQVRTLGSAPPGAVGSGRPAEGTP